MPANKMTAQVVVSAVDRMTAPLTRMGQRLDRFGAKARRVGSAMAVGLTAPVAAFGVSAFRASAGFEEAMNKVMALSSANANQFAQLNAKAKELGSTTRFTAREVADGMGFLAMAGLETGEILEAIAPSLDLATVAATELGEAADIATNVMSGFNLEAKDLGRVNDVLSKTITSSNTNLIELAEAMKMVAPTANAANISLEDTAAAIGALASKGLKGSIGGSGLSRVIESLLAEGIKINSITDLMDRLQDGSISATKILEFFGKRGGRAILALNTDGGESLAELTETIKNNAGATERMVKIMDRGAAGALRRFKSAVEGLQIAMADSGFLNALTRTFESLAKTISGMSQASRTTLAWASVILLLLAALAPVLFTLGMLASAFGKLMVLVPVVVTGFKLLGTVALALTSPFWAIWAVIGAVTAGLAALLFNVGGFRDAIVEAVTDALKWVARLLDKFNLLPRFLKKPLGLHTEFSGTPAVDHQKNIKPAGLTRIEMNKEATVRVKFDNMPENAKASIENDGGVPFVLEQGFQSVTP